MKKQTITIEAPPREVPILALSIEEAAESMGMSESKFKELMKDGTVRPARFGRKVVIYTEEIRRVLAAATEAA